MTPRLHQQNRIAPASRGSRLLMPLRCASARDSGPLNSKSASIDIDCWLKVNSYLNFALLLAATLWMHHCYTGGKG